MRESEPLFILKKEYEGIIFTLAKGEGCSLSFAQTVATIYDRPVTASPSETRLVQNIRNALNFVMELIENNQIRFDYLTFCEINRIVAENDNRDNLGGFRKRSVKVQGSQHKFLEPVQLREHFEALREMFSKQEPNNENIIKLALNLCKLQCFGDGNKRSSLLMMNVLLVDYGFTPFVVNFKDEDLITALLEFYDEDRIEPLYQAFLKRQMEVYESYEFAEVENKETN